MLVKEPRGEYANFLEVGHNAFEFVLHFGQAYESDIDPRIHTRIITNPVCAKAMLATLRTAMDAYETTNGPVNHESV